nr:hypothetical protein [Tanacetum cinerariifolium]
STDNSSEETVVSNPNHQEPPQNSDIHQPIEECSKKVCEEQKHNMENTVLKLVDICHQKQLLCMHDNVEDIIESALDTKLLSINSKSQHPNETDLEVKNVEEQLAEHEIECDMPAKDVCSPAFTTFSNSLFKDNDDLDSSNDELLFDEDVPAEEFKIYSNPLFDKDEINSDKLDLHCFNVESDFVESLLNHNSIPPGIENVADDPEGDVQLLIDDFILSHESSESNFEDNPSIPRPPPKPPDVESFFDLKTDVSPLLLSAESEDTIFDPGISD